jgi:hypothetical protein
LDTSTDVLIQLKESGVSGRLEGGGWKVVQLLVQSATPLWYLKQRRACGSHRRTRHAFQS